MPTPGPYPKACGGNNTFFSVDAAGFACSTEKTLDGGLTVRADVFVDQQGNASVVYVLAAPPATPVSLQVTAHSGTDATSGTDNRVGGLLPAGETSFPLGVVFPSRTTPYNQLSVKAWAGEHRTDVHWDAPTRITSPTFVWPT